MVDIDQAQAVKAAASGELFRVPGVHAVGLGLKRVRGAATDEVAIVCFVEKKLPPEELPPGALIAGEIEGVKTDVVQAGRARLYNLGGADRPLRGGLKLEPAVNGDGGTLGFIAENSDQSRIYAFTCWHVVGLPPGQGTNGKVAIIPVAAQNTPQSAPVSVGFFTSDGSGNLTPDRSLASVRLGVRPTDSRPPQNFHFVVASDSAHQNSVGNVGDMLAQQIGAATNLVTATNATSTSSSVGAQTIITITPAANVTILVDADISGRQSIPDADLHASVSGSAITLSGKVTGKFIGVYTTIYPSGPDVNTPGVYVPIPQSSSAASAATIVAAAITNMNIPNVTASASGSVITVKNVAAIECVVWRDNRIGEPNACYSSCCNSQVGAVAAGRRDYDSAVVQLDPGLQYTAEVKDIGFVTGAATAAPTLGLAVEKNGIMTGHTFGQVITLNVEGYAPLPDNNGLHFFPFHFTNAVEVVPAGQTAAAGEPFTDFGDSGAAVVQVVGTNACVIQGLLFGGFTAANSGLFLPIQSIMAVNPALSISKATQLNDVRTVKPFTKSAAPRAPAPSAAATVGLTRDRLREVEVEIEATEGGKQYTEMVRRHATEAGTLVNTNRRVGVAWQRNGGPVLLKAVLQALHDADRPLPPEIMGKPLDECLDALAAALRPHASIAFIADLDAFVPAVHKLKLGGVTYTDFLARLRPGQKPLRGGEGVSHG